MVGHAAYGEMTASVHTLAELAAGFVAVADTGLSDDVFAYRIDDKAMDGTGPQALSPGDIVIVDRQAPLEPGCVVFAGVGGRIAVRVYGEAESPAGGPPLLTLTPINVHFTRTTHPRDTLAFVFRVVVVQRRL